LREVFEVVEGFLLGIKLTQMSLVFHILHGEGQITPSVREIVGPQYFVDADVGQVGVT